MTDVIENNRDVAVLISSKNAMVLCTDGIWHMVNEGGQNAICDDALEHVDRIPVGAQVGENVCPKCWELWALLDPESVDILQDARDTNNILDSCREELSR